MAEWLREVSVGEWFETGERQFEIVGIDAKAGVVLIQHFDGSLEELDFDHWLELEARPCAPPEDITGALDMDLDDYDDPPTRSQWGSPLDDLNARLDDY
ncbi:MAG: DUF6763 family protein [Panacagrimonas sp.]